jgi:hypothetical protein
MQGFAKSFDQPDDTTRFPNGTERIVDLDGIAVGMATFEPGWRWSNDLRPLVGTDRCPFVHRGYVVSGRLHVELADGATLDLGPGELFAIEPHHDAWVVGDDACTILDWGGKARDYAQPAAQTMGGAR